MFRFQETKEVPPWAFLVSRNETYGPRALFLSPFELELELIQTQMAQKPMLRAEVGMRVRCANKASAE